MTDTPISQNPVQRRYVFALLNAEEMAALRRFRDTCEDGEGYDVPKEMMRRLAHIGVIRRHHGSWYEFTTFGQCILGEIPASPEDTHEEAVREAMAADLASFATSIGWEFCTFPPSSSPCEKCGEPHRQHYFQGPDDAGRYYCLQCVMNEHEANIADAATVYAGAPAARTADVVATWRARAAEHASSTDREHQEYAAGITDVLNALAGITPSPVEGCACDACVPRNELGSPTAMPLCPDCGDKRCAKAKSHMNACSAGS